MFNVKRKLIAPLTAAGIFVGGVSTAAATHVFGTDPAASATHCATWSVPEHISNIYSVPIVMWDAGGGLRRQVVKPHQEVTWSVPGHGAAVVDTLYATAADGSTRTASTEFQADRPAHC